MHFVIGSGPAGAMCARALLDARQQVTLLDVGRTLEPERQQLVNELAGDKPERWDRTAVDRLRGNPAESVELKRVHGSAFPYAFDSLKEIQQTDSNCMISFAKGGLSNVWGAGMLPLAKDDFDRWPFRREALEHGYTQVARHVPVAGTADALSSFYPYYGPPRESLRLSRQAKHLLAKFDKSNGRLQERGFLYGRARLAVYSVPEPGNSGCQYCSLCLTGCVYNCIWCSSTTVDAMSREPGFNYRPGLRVVRIQEHESGVTIDAVEVGTGRTVQFAGERTFLGCGPIATLRILLKSQLANTRDVKIAYQPYFLIPAIMRRKIPHVVSEKTHTLAQLFMQLRNPDVVNGAVHLSIYTYNELMRSHMRSRFGRFRVLPWALEGLLLGRLIAIQGYLSSTESEPITVSGGADKLQLVCPADEQAGAAVNRVARFLARHARLLDWFPIPSATKRGLAGDGNHIGGIFPMGTPGAAGSDLLGRPCGLRRTHVVDASVLPTLPAGPPTYTVMANAYRIGHEVIRQKL